MRPFTKDQAHTIAGVLHDVRERVRQGEVGVAMMDYAIEKGLEDMLALHSFGFDRPEFASRIHAGKRPSYDEDRGALPDDTEELEAASEVLDNAEVTAIALWAMQARVMLKPILDDAVLTGGYLDVEGEAMSGIVQKVQDAYTHLGKIPKEVDGESEG